MSWFKDRATRAGGWGVEWRGPGGVVSYYWRSLRLKISSNYERWCFWLFYGALIALSFPSAFGLTFYCLFSPVFDLGSSYQRIFRYAACFKNYANVVVKMPLKEWISWRKLIPRSKSKRSRPCDDVVGWNFWTIRWCGYVGPLTIHRYSKLDVTSLVRMRPFLSM